MMCNKQLLRHRAASQCPAQRLLWRLFSEHNWFVCGCQPLWLIVEDSNG